MKVSILITLLAVMCFLSSCHQCHRDYVCTADVILIGTSGFSTYELDSLYIEKYTQDGTFTHKVDSFSVTNEGAWINDSSKGSEGLNFRHIKDGFDYIFKIPLANREYKFSKITNEGKLQERENFSCGQEPTNRGCVNGITSFYLDGSKLNQSWAILVK